MNKRIKVIASYIDDSDKVVDIGCDQALLSEILAKRGITSISSDIKENIVLKAKERINSLGLDKYVSFFISDGLKEVNAEYDSIVLSGMGTFTILNILNYLNKPIKKIITISNNNHYLLRKEMSKKGYKIYAEEIIFERGKYYNLIIFIPGKERYSEEDFTFGVKHSNKELYYKKLEYELNKYKEISEKHSDEEIDNKIKSIEKKLKSH